MDIKRNLPPIKKPYDGYVDNIHYAMKPLISENLMKAYVSIRDQNMKKPDGS